MAAYNLQLKRKTASALENVYVSTKWELVDGKPSWIGSNKPSYTWSEIGSKPTTFNPSSHSHGNITNDGKIGTTANRVIVTGTGGILTAKAAGTTSQFLRGDGNWATQPLELLRDRGHGSNLDHVGSGTTSGYVVLDKTISPGDTLMIEVSKYSGGTYNPKIVTVTVGTSSSIASTTDADYLNSWSYFNGTIMGIYTFTCWAGGSSSSYLYFGAKRYIQGSFSGTNINWTTSTYSLYVGRVWRVNR